MKPTKYLMLICLLIISFACRKKNPCEPAPPCGVPPKIDLGVTNFKIIDKDSSDLVFDKKLLNPDSLFSYDKYDFSGKKSGVIFMTTSSYKGIIRIPKNRFTKFNFHLQKKVYPVELLLESEPQKPDDCCPNPIFINEISVDNKKICSECYKQEVIYIVIPDECIPKKKGS